MTSKTNTQKGKEAEEIAVKFLQNFGCEIIERNYRYKRGEIDIIVRHEKIIIFVEVKSRKNNNFGFPEEAVSDKKVDLIHQTADNYLIENNLTNEIRFDIIAITGMESNIEIEHLIDAF